MKPYFEYINIPNLASLSKNLLKAMPPEIKSKKIVFGEYNPSFLKDVPGLIDAIGLIRPWSDVHNVSLIVQHPNTTWPIHIDGLTNSENLGVAFNIPIFNCEKCYSIIYETVGEIDPQVEWIEITDLPYRELSDTQVKEVARINYKDHAVLINTAKPHTIVNPTNLPRIVASFRFSPPILWQ